ncbi:MAG: hypothetical protein ACOCRX_01605 [Candidatus Woesearchaeota archaeon]
MKTYKGYKYYTDNGIWKVLLDNETEFIVALDDSKIKGKKEIIWEMNNEETCKKLINILVKK